MSLDLLISILISTRNRASALRETLEALGKVRIPHGWKAEIIVVDNASTDDTAAVVQSVELSNIRVEYLYESRPGLSNARNAGLARARGELILFTDDDVFVPEDWVEQMIAAFLQIQADAIVGRVVLAEDLSRPWINGRLKWWLAAPDDQSDEFPELIGANMAIRRAVLERVPGFDPELGSGTLGFCEESLFGKQLVAAGFKVKYAPNAVVVHRPERRRLRRGEWLNTARKKGRAEAYVRYHWEHKDIQAPRAKCLWYMLKLQLRRILQALPPLDAEDCSAWEISYVHKMEACRQFCIERRRPRNYSPRGLEKRARVPDRACPPHGQSLSRCSTSEQ